MKLLLCIVCTFFFGCIATTDKPIAVVVDLNSGWQFRHQGQTNWHNATVPGSVQADLLALGQLPDPFYGLNEKNIQWVEKHLSLIHI